jgi:hypothetical protein
MDWKTFLASITSSTVIAAIIGYLFKSSFDRTIELWADRIKEDYKATITETTRRKALLFDKQFEPYRLMVSRVYHLRCAHRDLAATPLEHNEKEFCELVERYNRIHDECNSSMIEDRALFTAEFWTLIHDLRNLSNCT